MAEYLWINVCKSIKPDVSASHIILWIGYSPEFDDLYWPVIWTLDLLATVVCEKDAS